MKILVVVAMEKEARPILAELGVVRSDIQINEKLGACIYSKTEGPNTIYILVNGKDRLHHTDLLGSGIIPSVTLAIHSLNPNMIINVGSAGGFSKRGAERHEVYLSDGVFQFHDHLFGPDTYHTPYGVGNYPVYEGVSTLSEQLGLKKARISTGNSMLASREEEVQMEKNRAVLKEMEAAHIAQVASLFEIPFFAIKGVTDLVDTTACPQEQFAENIQPLSEKLAKVLHQVLIILSHEPTTQQQPANGSGSGPMPRLF